MIKKFEEFVDSINNSVKLDEMAIKRETFSNYDEIEPFDSEHIKVTKDGLYNIVDSDGNLLSDVWFDSIEKKSGGGFDVEFRDKGGDTHSGKFLDLPELKKNVEIRNLVKHTDILDSIDFGDIILVDPYILKRPDMKRGIKIIATVTYMGENLLLGVDGRLYDPDGILFDGIQFAISQIEIKRIMKKMDEMCSVLDSEFSPKKKGGPQGNEAYENHISVIAFGFNTNATDVNYEFNTGTSKLISKSELSKPWGKRSINSIKVRFMPSINEELRKILKREFGYITGTVDDFKKYWKDGVVLTKEYLPTEIDEMFIELDKILEYIEKA